MALLELIVNGVPRHVDADPERTLLSVLRDELDLTGSKYGCGEGQCGACTVLLDGVPRRSCQTRVGSIGGQAVTTIEGLEQDGRLHPVQQAFAETDALQCGYCTPGMIVEAVALLRRKADPSEAEVAHALEGHICRCGTYARIVRAVRRAAAAPKASR
ncbi:MAG: ferredoxin [Acidobacteria bacterium]|nr:MAG: ferredoxin [Acidobacteriota bacterium]